VEAQFVELASNPAEVAFDRRSKSRIEDMFPAKMRGIATDGQVISESCVVQNMSATGLYVRAQHALSLGSDLEVIVQLFVAEETGSTIQTTGKVVRVERLRDGSHGLAMVISRHRFL
jgi:hypothetical protein